MKRIFTLTLLSLITALAALAAPKASELVSAAAAKMRAAKGITVAFTATGTGAPTRGTLTIAGNRFAIDAPRAKVWYDGKTQWTWSADAAEVDITEPTIEEVAQVNPYAIISSLASRYKASYLGNPSQRTVVLTPAMPNPQIERAEITFGADGFPSRMNLVMASGEKVKITVTSVAIASSAPPAKTFTHDPAKTPGAEVVDLR